MLSSVTLIELENIKVSNNKTEDIRFAARKAVRFLKDNSDKYRIIVYDILSSCDFTEYGLEDTPDNRIMRCAEYARDILGYKNLVFVTNDILCKLIAKSYFNLDVESIDGNEEIYKGYKEVVGNTELINKYMSCFDKSDWCVNEYIIIHNTDDDSIKEMRFDGENFVSLKLPPSKFIKAKNSLQRCALDALMNPNISVVSILGTYGSGKSFLCTKMALYHVTEKGNQSSILGIREIRGEGLEPGYLPGDLDDKTKFFFAPIAQQLDGGEFELESLRQRGVIDFQIPYFLKGTTFNSTILLSDEAEDLNESQIRLIGTRVGENSRLFFSGDYKQSVLNKTGNNALIKMCNELKGNPMFACVCLDDDVRSNTSKLFAELFQH